MVKIIFEKTIDISEVLWYNIISKAEEVYKMHYLHKILVKTNSWIRDNADSVALVIMDIHN